jgi:hypothetical protein
MSKKTLFFDMKAKSMAAFFLAGSGCGCKERKRAVYFRNALSKRSGF